jgi:hypothetical protein
MRPPSQSFGIFRNGISLQNRTFATLLLLGLGSWAQDSSVFRSQLCAQAALTSRLVKGSKPQWSTISSRSGSSMRLVSRSCNDVPNSLIEHALQISLCERRTLQVLVCPDLLCNNQCLVIRNWLHALLSQALKCSRILSQVELRTNEDDGDRGSMVINLGEPLCQRS